MQGRHEYQPELFSQIDVEALIPKNHILRKIDRILDLSFLREVTAPFYSESVGRPSIDPEIFVRMNLLEHLYNIPSDRQLCEEVGFNLAYRWFCKLSMKDQVPDHSSMTKLRDRFGESTYRRIFLEVIAQCRKAGLVKGEKIMTDGSLIEADAAKKSLTPRDPDDKNDYIKKGGPRMTNSTHVSKTDPESTLAGKESEKKFLSYKTHFMADFESRVILECPVTTGATHEVTVFSNNLEQMKKEQGVNVGEVIADRGFGSAVNLRYLERQKIKSNIPLWSSRPGKSLTEKLQNGFILDDKNMSIHCPEGHRMKPSFQDKSTGQIYFRVFKKICDLCPRKNSCLSAADIKAGRGKRFLLPEHFDIFLNTLEKEKNPDFKQKLRERMWKMEGLFAEAKSIHGMGRARYRSRWKVQIQVYMIATVQNLKRLVNGLFDEFISVLGQLIRIDHEQIVSAKSF